MKDDQSFERLLRKARPVEPAPGGIGPCLDAETLAAWVDGGLRSNELRQAELHVSSCARCQAMVAATMTSAPLVAASETERRAFSWSLRWLVPAAAGVAAVGLWFMVPSRPLPTPAPASQVVELDRREIAQGALEQPAAAPAAAPEAPRDRVAPERSAAKLADAVSPKNEEQRQASPDAKDDAFRAQAPRADEFAPVRSRQEAERKEMGAVPSPSPAASAPMVAVSGSTAVAPMVPPPAGLSAIASSRSAAFRLVIEILSPNASMRWRIAPGGSIEHSSDAGASWTPQSSGVSVDLLAGSSPSADVCWLVGRGGTVLRTTDGGRQWQRVTLVGGTDLQTVTATDASTAEVTAADGRRFRTVDAGITWR